jgi:drug/metabolite transporter (DMT)-like permease
LWLTALLTSAAMVAFAANSLLARAALGVEAIGAADYTILRLVSGAVAMAALLASQRGLSPGKLPGTWTSGLALFGYAVAFSYAYLRLGAATGALILFAAVQATMIGGGLLRGDRPTLRQVAGLGIAFAGLVWLLLPGLGTPDLLGAATMIASGIAWGVYSLRGRGAGDPLAETSGNFVRSVVFCVPLLFVAPGEGVPTAAGAGLAVASGAIASGLGYIVWYRALPRLSRVQAAIVQLTVPPIAAFGAVLVLSETLTMRLAVASVLILAGILLAVVSTPATRTEASPKA